MAAKKKRKKNPTNQWHCQDHCTGLRDGFTLTNSRDVRLPPQHRVHGFPEPCLWLCSLLSQGGALVLRGWGHTGHIFHGPDQKLPTRQAQLCLQHTREHPWPTAATLGWCEVGKSIRAQPNPMLGKPFQSLLIISTLFLFLSSNFENPANFSIPLTVPAHLVNPGRKKSRKFLSPFASPVKSRTLFQRC